jgi:alkylated DNA repair dioxygenase AlkB
VLVSYYRNGADYMGWHSDDEKDLGERPVIASISLGAAREFQFRHKQSSHSRESIVLEHGSLLVMHHPTNRDWKHALPKRGGTHPERIGARLNLTFRRVATTRTRA